MKTFTVVPIIKDGNCKYNAPCFYVDAIDNASAFKEAKSKSGLARFTNCNFHIIETSKVKKPKPKLKIKNKLDENSKSQIGKKITGQSNSRPVRRALRRLSIARGVKIEGAKIAGAMKMW